MVGGSSKEGSSDDSRESLLMGTMGGAKDTDHGNGELRFHEYGPRYDEEEAWNETDQGLPHVAGMGHTVRLSKKLSPGNAGRVFLEHVQAFWVRAIQWLISIPYTARQLGFSGTMRAIFNYPEPGLELRSTAWLDGLRGLAAFEVFIFHYDDGWIDRSLGWGTEQFMEPEWYYAPLIRTVYASGDAAVCLFFAISGYVLSYRMLSLLRRQQYDQLLSSLSSAVFRRGIRLYMPVMVETFALMILCRWFSLPKPVHYEPAETFWLELKNWYIAFLHLLLPLRYPDRWDAIQDRYDGGISWTIPLEYYGSLYVYASALFLARVQSVLVRRCLILGMALQSFAKDDWIAAQFMMGMAFADFQLEREEREKQEATRAQPPRQTLWRRWIRPTVFVALFVFGFFMSGLPGGRMVSTDPGDYRVMPRPYYDWVVQPVAWTGLYFQRQTDRYILCVATMCSLMGIGETALLKRILTTRPVQYLGRISFGLYLCHIFVRAWMEWLPKTCIALVGLDPNVAYSMRPESENGRLFLAYLMTMYPAMITNFIVAGLFERFLDRPSVEAGRKWERWCLSFGETGNGKGKAKVGVLGEQRLAAEATPLQMQEVGVTEIKNDREEHLVRT